jgi:acyl carrier protein
MNRQEIEEIVIEIIAEELSIDTREINLDSTFIDLGADSLDETEIMIHVEKKFHITISDDSAATLNNVRDLCKFIENNLQK